MRVGIDLDGVVYDFAASYRAYLCESGISVEENCPPTTRWEFYEDWGFSVEEFIQHCNDGVDAGIIFRRGKPFPGAREAFDLLRAAGHTLHIVTDRSFGKSSEYNTRGWLDEYGLKFDSLTFTRDKTCVRLDTMVDDKIENYDALDEEGVAVYLLTRPWNEREDTRHRVSDILEYAELIVHG